MSGSFVHSPMHPVRCRGLYNPSMYGLRHGAARHVSLCQLPGGLEGLGAPGGPAAGCPGARCFLPALREAPRPAPLARPALHHMPHAPTMCPMLPPYAPCPHHVPHAPTISPTPPHYARASIQPICVYSPAVDVSLKLACLGCTPRGHLSRAPPVAPPRARTQCCARVYRGNVTGKVQEGWGDCIRALCGALCGEF
jgi:hypothetical protein